MTGDPSPAAEGSRRPGAAARLGRLGRRCLGLCLDAARQLSPAAGSPLPPVHGVPVPLAWLPHAALGVLALVLGGVAAGQVREAGTSGLLAVALGVAQGLALVVALVRPLAGFWVSATTGMLVSEVVRAGGPGPVWTEPSLLVHLAVLALVGLRCRPAVLVTLWLLTLLAGAILVQRMPGLNASADLGEMTTLSAVVLVAAGALRGRREALRRLADQEQVSEAERLHRSLLEERARIARELHDVVAHHMSLIAIQAEAAPYRVPDPPPELTRSFTTIRTNAVQAMTELRRVLGVLRTEVDRTTATDATTEPDGIDEPGGPTRPQPTLDHVHELLDGVREAGLRITATTVGDPRPLTPGVELSAYRIAQEALSNAMRHAPNSDVRIELRYTPATLTIRVVNDPPPTRPTPPGRPGHGILGMHERAAMLGGQLTVGPLPNGGYTVEAVLPTDTTTENR